eukprot:1007752-Prymnesium_polylepis.1
MRGTPPGPWAECTSSPPSRQGRSACGGRQVARWSRAGCAPRTAERAQEKAPLRGSCHLL